MAHPITTYLRRERRTWALRQKDLAALLGVSPTHISRIENGGTEPTLEIALSLQIIFGAAPAELFPAHYRNVEEIVMHRAYQMYQRLDGRTDARGLRKRALVEAMLARATKKPHRTNT